MISLMKTNSEFIEQVNAIVGNEYSFLEAYVGALKKIKIKHNKCENEYSVRPNDFLNGKRCPKCKGGSLHSQQEITKVLNDHGYMLLNKYINANIPVLAKTIEGYLFMVKIPNLKNGQNIRLFGRSNPHTINNIKLWCVLNNKNFKLESDKYDGNIKHLQWKCLNSSCGEIFEMSWGSISQGRGCSFCTGKHVGNSNSLSENKPNLADEWNYERNCELTPHMFSIRSDKKVWWKCKCCNFEWEASISNRSGGTGCPKCYESKGEKSVANYLTAKKIIFVREYRIKDCKYIRPLPFDFALFIDDKILCLIEYDGEHHFRAIGRLRINEFETIKKRDIIKDNFCKNKSIPLIRIPYTEADIEGYLEKKLNQLKHCHI